MFRLKPVSYTGQPTHRLPVRRICPVNYQFQFDAVFAAWPLLLKGTWITIQLSLVATVLGSLHAKAHVRVG